MSKPELSPEVASRSSRLGALLPRLDDDARRVRAGRGARARAHLEATRALHEGLGTRTGWARATAVLGLTFLMTGDRARARELFEEALAADVAEEDDWGQGHCHVYLGIIKESRGGGGRRAS